MVKKDHDNSMVGEWAYIAPILGLELTDAVNGELAVENVIFIRKSKLYKKEKS